ncbi:M20 family metallo-hydrolase [Lonepinella koalarum]|uniref:Aminobenzoyl-glutamate utilization protein A n=1 Tax=Lonepinella koalarum TaxID=53417 RepID=A0A4R1KYQ5_9PAST|nr:M20 family metallo-hydrolase [Lonepinella koalarum]MDH2926684.1 peptidase M20 [Lonepinella koalarum]TCK70655.1 aminobenzoyl-glutamate utilization protein A [Lonepinella koalarum]TFJ89966.1 amidohydrolase [Lonepinella koalarum]
MTDLNQLIQWRREFHRFPETGWSEFWTTSRIADYLEEMGAELLFGKQIINSEFVRGRNQKVVDKGIQNALAYGAKQKWLDKMDGYTGCVAIFDSGKAGKTVALRFDIDCVNVGETKAENHIPNQLGFASINDGFMHACGHDGHITIGLGTALWLSQNKDKYTGKVKIVFQPAEEGVRGAAAIAASGVIDDADYFASSHISFCAFSGTVIPDLKNFLSTTKIDIRYRGKPAHAGAAPHLGRNALLAAAHAVTQLHGIARHGSGMTRINVGVLNAGEGRNVVPSKAEIQLEVRGENKEINQYMVDQVMQIARGAAISFDVAYETEIMGEAVDMSNDKALVELVSEIALQQPQVNEIVDYAFNASEDATILGRRVQEQGGKAIYFILGADRTAGHHEAEFDFDERQLETGVNVYTALVGRLLGD